MREDKSACYRLIQGVALHQFPYCRVPGCRNKAVAGHHAFPRSRQGTAFNPKAVISLCLAHHGFAHTEPEMFRPTIESIIGDEYEALRKLSLMEVQFREEDYKRIAAALNKILDNITYR